MCRREKGQKKKHFNLPYWLKDGISLLSGIITIVGAIFGIYKIRKCIVELPDGKYNIVVDGWLVSIAVALVFLSITMFIQMRKYGRLLYNLRKSTSENVYNFLHDFRNQYFEMIKEHKHSVSDSNDEHKIEVMTKITKDFLVKEIDYLCEIISSSCNQKISACIKIVDNIGSNGNPIKIDEAYVSTFCRSTNTESDRLSGDNINKDKSVKLVDNTDFYDIVMGESRDGFYQQNLQEYAKKLEEVGKSYRNTTPEYWKYYRGTVVAPIRIARKRLYYTESDENYDVIGFLCVDTLSTDVFRENEKFYYLKLVKAFAAESYIILNKYNYYLNKEEKVA